MPNPSVNRRVGGQIPKGYLLLEDGTYLVLEASTNRLAVTPKGSVQPGDLSANAGLALADEGLITNDPAGTPASQAATIQRVIDAINLLSASAALTLADVIPVFTASGIRKATIQKVFDAIETLADATTPLTGDELIVISDGTALSMLLSDWVTSTNNVNLFTTDGIIVKGSVLGTDAAIVTPRGDAIAVSASGTGATSAGATSDANTPPSWSLITGTQADTGRCGVNGISQFNLGHNLRFSCIFKISADTEIRLWCGLFSQAHSGISGTGTPSGEWIGFRYDTDAGDSNFMYTYGTGGSGQYISTGVDADTNLHCAEFRVLGNGNVNFYLDRVLIASNVVATTSPSTSLQFVLGGTPLSGSSRTVSYCRHQITQRFVGV